MAIAYGIVKLFYPPTIFSVIPIVSLIKCPALGIIQLVILGLMVAFAYPVRTRVAGESLLTIRKLAMVTALGYLLFSLMPLAFHVEYIQTYVGLVIAADIINGAFAGVLSSLI
ncbi:conserved hypothetical protein [Acidianus hospitalis W1]|uniref:Uncharacterized protein n=1 Tax=Acidianus hospitalis (strain W1) TaxID=933801 RepID=F4B7P3_ACIHW|nr:hypothetical protein [Acidianus hospitalis]AEE94790.1 conserved hypothetical protein [Acidianus hospitalis W1]